MFLTTLMVSRSISSSGLMDCTLEEANSLGMYGYKIESLDISNNLGYRTLCFTDPATTIEDIKTDNPVMWHNRVFARFEGVTESVCADFLLHPSPDLRIANILGLQGYIIKDLPFERVGGKNRIYFEHII
jgi:hypothetical protein